MAPLRFALAGLLLLAGCARTATVAPVSVPQPTDEPSAAESPTARPVEADEDVQGEPNDDPAQSDPGAIAGAAPRPSNGQSWRTYTMSYQVSVADPRVALGEVSGMLASLGAEVTSSSSTEAYGYVSATFSSAVRTRIRQGLEQMNLAIASESVSHNDLATSVRQAEERLYRIEAAREHVLEAIRRTRDRETSDGLMLLLEMTENERRNLESQLDTYRGQIDQNSVSISFSKASP